MFGRIAAAARAASRVAPRVALTRAVASGAVLTAGAMVISVAKPATAEAEAVPFTGLPGTPHERSFVALKPDAVQRGLIGDIIKRFEQKGYKLVAMKFLKPTSAQAAEHYADLSKKPFFPGLVAFFSSGPIVAMVWEGQGVIKGTRQLLGTTNPVDSMPGSIRGDFCVVTGRNIIHASDGPESAKAEITNWFAPSEVVEWTPSTATWVYEGK